MDKKAIRRAHRKGHSLFSTLLAIYGCILVVFGALTIIGGFILSNDPSIANQNMLYSVVNIEAFQAVLIVYFAVIGFVIMVTGITSVLIARINEKTTQSNAYLQLLIEHFGN